MKVVIIGGVAGGASAAARLRRLDEDAQIIILERGQHISYANCGLPYHIGEVITDRNRLLLQTPESLRESLDIDVRIATEVVSIDRAAKTVTVTARVTPKNLASCVGDATIICEAFDKADQKAMLAREVRCQKPDAYLVSGSGMAGFGKTGLMKVREVSPHFYLCGDSVSAPKPGAGLMAPRVAICSAMMANVVTWLLLGKNGAY